MNKQSLSEFIGRLEEALGDEAAGRLSADSFYKDLSAWSSINALAVVVMVDEYYGIQLGAKDFEECGTVRELHDRVVAASVR